MQQPKELLLRLGLDESGLQTELGPVIASFNFDTGVNVEAMNKEFTGGSATYDQRLGCAVIQDNRHNLKLYVWPNGKCVASDARHPKYGCYVSSFLEKSITRKQSIIVSDIMANEGLAWQGPILDNHFHLNRNGRFLDAAKDFKNAGGTSVVLVHCPDFSAPPTTKLGHRESYQKHDNMAESVRKEVGLGVRVVLGPHLLLLRTNSSNGSMKMETWAEKKQCKII